MRPPEPATVDVVIVGAGPAGGAAALALADQGVSVRVLEGGSLPRSKPCGGLLPKASLAVLPRELEPPVLNRTGSFQFRFGAERRFDRRLPGEDMLLVDRSRFDEFLVREAERMGRGSLELCEGARVVAIRECDQQVELLTECGTKHLARAVIAADGVNSSIRRLLGLQTPAHGAAIEWNIALDGPDRSGLQDSLTFSFGALDGGYGWSFPRGGHGLNIGVIAWKPMGRLPARLAEFTEDLLGDTRHRPNRANGFPIPYFDGDYGQATNRVCFAGDAAGLVDGVSGEGIRFALASGAMAARHVLDRIGRGGAGALRETYVEDLRRHCAGPWKLEQVRRFVRLPFMQRPDYFFDHILKPAKFPFYWSW